MIKRGITLKLSLNEKRGYFRETEDEALMEKVDKNGNVVGFSTLKVSDLQDKPLSISLKSHVG